MGRSSEVTCVRGESFVVSDGGGDLVPGRDHGFYVRDVRFLDHLELQLNGAPVAALAGRSTGPGEAVFHGYLPPAHHDQVDPQVLVTRRRAVAGGLRDEVELRNMGSASESMVVELHVGTDFAEIFDVRHRRVRERAPAATHPSSIALEHAGGDETTLLTIRLDGALAHPVIVHVPGGATAWVQVDVPGRGSRHLAVDVAARGNFGTVEPGPAPDPGIATPGAPTSPVVHASDGRLARLVRRSASDLGVLVTPDPQHPADRYAAAGSPWFLTLFGRDSIWAALMALPFRPELAPGTLRTLARRQGRVHDPETEEEPGKILHEVRHGAMADRRDLPPFYYGSIDATPLFVVLAHEWWRWGGRDAELEPLMGHVEAALEWMVADGDADGDGFLEYRPSTGRGLANQGWKDSVDGIRFADGRLARAPLALAEVQAYAHAAALGGADLLDHAGRPGGADWRAWAAGLADRFRARFWVADDHGPYPAMALDADGVPVDAVASNMGHLLVTGLLAEDEVAHVAARLTAPDMASGYGLRTMSAHAGGYNPLSYHCGSVWPHDTAIAAWGLARTRQADAAAVLVDQLLTAGPAFDHRLPELFAGFGRDEAAEPVPYPSACQPQAWAAGAGLLVPRILFGLEPDVPAGILRLAPLPPRRRGRLTWDEVAVGDRRLRLTLGPDAEVEVTGSDLEVEVAHHA